MPPFLAIAAGSYAAAQLIASRLNISTGGWRFIVDRHSLFSLGLQHTLVLVNQESLLEDHPDGDVILDLLLERAEQGLIVFASIDPTLYPTTHGSPDLPLTR